MKRNPSALRKWWCVNRANVGLAPKVIVKKTLTSGKIGVEIKRLNRENPQLAVRDYPAKLREIFGDENDSETRVPEKSTIGNFLLQNKLVPKKLIKKQFISQKNMENGSLLPRHTRKAPPRSRLSSIGRFGVMKLWYGSILNKLL